jgi:hypothetical protein
MSRIEAAHLMGPDPMEITEFSSGFACFDFHLPVRSRKRKQMRRAQYLASA